MGLAEVTKRLSTQKINDPMNKHWGTPKLRGWGEREDWKVGGNSKI